MILGNFLASSDSVRISFVGDKSAEISGALRGYDEHHLVVLHGGREKYIPWTAVGAVTNLSKPIVMDED